jgi:hypothetical protein
MMHEKVAKWLDALIEQSDLTVVHLPEGIFGVGVFRERFLSLLKGEPVMCKRCGGSGIVTVSHCPGEGFDPVDWDEACPECSHPPTSSRDRAAMDFVRAVAAFEYPIPGNIALVMRGLIADAKRIHGGDDEQG